MAAIASSIDIVGEGVVVGETVDVGDGVRVGIPVGVGIGLGVNSTDDDAVGVDEDDVVDEGEAEKMRLIANEGEGAGERVGVGAGLGLAFCAAVSDSLPHPVTMIDTNIERVNTKKRLKRLYMFPPDPTRIIYDKEQIQ